MVEALCARFAVDQIDVVGFSLGATVATMAATRAKARIRTLIAVGIDVDFAESERFAYAFAMRQAKERGHGRALQKLREIGDPPHDDSKRFLTRVQWVTNFGGIHRTRTFAGLVRTNVWALLTSPHYAFGEALRAIRAMSVTQERMLAELAVFDIRRHAPRIEVPVFFFQGRHDVAAPPEVVERYFSELEAPRGKALVWFEESAHMPHYEQPAQFRAALLDAIRSSAGPSRSAAA